MCMCKQLVAKQVGANIQLYNVVAFLPTSAAISKSCLYACLLYVYYKYISILLQYYEEQKLYKIVATWFLLLEF